MQFFYLKKNASKTFLGCKVRQDDCFSIGFDYRKFDSGHAGTGERFKLRFPADFETARRSDITTVSQ